MIVYVRSSQKVPKISPPRESNVVNKGLMDAVADNQLIELFVKTGEMHHLNDLVSRHIGKVRAMIYPMVLNDADADELTQEVFLRVTRHIKKFKRSARFSTWLYRIAMNTTHSFISKKGRNRVDILAEPPERHDHSRRPDTSLAADEMDSRVHDALSGLSPKLRSAITLTAIHGMSTTEAASAEGCVAATMYWRIHEARKILKQRLAV